MSSNSKIPPKAIFFDFGDTLVETAPPYIERMRMAFEAEGLKFTFKEVEKAYIEADWRSAKALIERKPFPREAWQELFMAIMIEVLRIEPHNPEFIRKIAADMASIAPTRQLIAGVKDFLLLCRKNKIKMAIVSNNDGRTAMKADEVGIRAFFELIVDSTVENISKPDPTLFKIALDRLNLHAADCLHVGDLLGCDVLGGKAAGMITAWFHQREYTPNTDIVPDIKFRDFAELAAKLGLL